MEQKKSKENIVTTEAEESASNIVTAPEISNEKFFAIEQLANNAEKLAEQLNKIRKFVFQRALPGDFVRFNNVIELGSAGTERIAAALGISFTDMKSRKIEGQDAKGKWYMWVYTCTVVAFGRKIEGVEGKYSTREKLLGVVNGEIKPIEDINEAHIMSAARHCAMKAGVKELLGLRRIPEAYAIDLGLNPAAVTGHTFKGSKAPTDTSQPSVMEAVLQSVETEKRGKWTFYLAITDKGKLTISKNYNAEKRKQLEGLAGQTLLMKFLRNQYGLQLLEHKVKPETKMEPESTEDETKNEDGF